MIIELLALSYRTTFLLPRIFAKPSRAKIISNIWLIAYSVVVPQIEMARTCIFSRGRNLLLTAFTLLIKVALNGVLRA